MARAGNRYVSSLVRLIAGVGALAGLVAFLGPDWAEVGQRLDGHPAFLGGALVATACASLLGALRWKLLNEQMTTTRLPYTTYVHYVVLTRLVGQFSSMLLVDFLGRGVGLRHAGSQQGLGRLITPVIVERVVDVIFPAVGLAWAVLWHTDAGPRDGWALALAVTLVGASVCIAPLVRPAARVVLWAYGRITSGRGRSFSSPEVVVSSRLTATLTVLGLGRYLAVLAQFYSIGAGVGAIDDLGVVASAFPVSQLSAIVAVTPGGLGIQDAGWAGALAWQGVDENSIAMFLLAIHAGVIANFALLSALSLPFAGRRSTMAAPVEHEPQA